MAMKQLKKLSAVGISVPLSVIFAWLIPVLGGPVIPTEIAAAGGAVITYLVSVLIPDHMEV